MDQFSGIGIRYQDVGSGEACAGLLQRYCFCSDKPHQPRFWHEGTSEREISDFDLVMRVVFNRLGLCNGSYQAASAFPSTPAGISCPAICAQDIIETLQEPYRDVTGTL
jgi:hypothetical protein